MPKKKRSKKKKTKKKIKSKKKKVSKKRGRPTKHNLELQTQIMKLAREGFNDLQISEIVGISERSINYWKGNKEGFLHLLKKNKSVADDLVEASLFQNATGYTVPEEKVFQSEGSIITHDTLKHYAPNTIAQIFWLSNRRGKDWKQKQEVEIGEETRKEFSLKYNLAKKGKPLGESH